jgi:zinc transport system permease protein
MSVLDDFSMRAGLAGVGVALAAGPPGCFVVWRRMDYCGDAASHAAILGVALALVADVPVIGGLPVAATAMAVAVARLAGKSWAMDTPLGVVAHAALAFGLMAAAFLPGARLDLEAFLPDDILAASSGDLDRRRAARRADHVALAPDVDGDVEREPRRRRGP